MEIDLTQDSDQEATDAEVSIVDLTADSDHEDDAPLACNTANSTNNRSGSDYGSIRSVRRRLNPREPEQAVSVAGDPSPAGAVATEAAKMPGRDTNALADHLVTEWGNCYRCGQPGHFKGNCPLNSTPVKAHWSGVCARCGGRWSVGDRITRNDTGDGWFHVKCQLGDVAAQISRARRPGLALIAAAVESGTDPIQHFVQYGAGHGLIVSAAGSGKTHQLVQVYKRAIAMGQSARVCVFNKDAAAELQSRGLPKADARTFHSFGYASWAKAHKGSELKPQKSRQIIQELYPLALCDGPRTTHTKKSVVVAYFGRAAESLVSLAKQQGAGIAGLADQHDELFWVELYNRHNLGALCRRAWKKMSDARQKYAAEKWPVTVVQREQVVGLAREAFEESVSKARETPSIIDYDDMLYMPLLDDLPLGSADWVLVDEAQDSNPVRRKAAYRMLKPSTGRLVAVGDPCQSINGFCGASSEALKAFQLEIQIPKHNVMHLPVCRRCPKTHVALANELIHKMGQPDVDEIQPMPGAADGVIVKDADFVSHPPSQNCDHGILCRSNAPLLKLQYKLASVGIGCRMLGRQKLLKKLIVMCEQVEKSHGVSTIEDLVTSLPAFLGEKEDEADVTKDPADERCSRVDLAACISSVISRLPMASGPLEPLYVELNQLYNEGDGQKGCGLLTLSTVHKAKGLEYERVYILEPGELKLWQDKGQPWQQLQEKNIEYVACTRAKAELIFLRDVGVDHLESLFGPLGGESGQGGQNGGEQHAPPPGGEDGEGFDEWRNYCRGQHGNAYNGADDDRDQDSEAEAADPYEVLGVSGTASMQEIRSARAALLKQYHPDKQARASNPLSTEEASRKTRRVYAAFDRLVSEHAGYS